MLLTILGAGESGVGTAKLAKKLGFDVFVSDKGPIAPNFQEELNSLQIEFESNKHTIEKILAADEIVKSPGIPDKVEIIQLAREKGIPVISEIEFAGRYTDAKIIGITGSNGKTTTTSLVYHLMHSAGVKVGVGGNIGFSFARLVEEGGYDWIVLELSSFQLDGIDSFRPNISIVLNITPDHLDRYNYLMSNYVRSKFRIMMNQKENDLFIYNQDDTESMNFLKHRRFRMRHTPVKEKFYKGGVLRYGKEHVFSMEESSLKGPHNWFNAYCAVAAVLEVGIDDRKIQDGLKSFVNAPHRLEFVATIDGVDYINDSKATNVDSVYWALLSMKKPTVLILGGQDKGNEYDQIDQLVKNKVKAIVAMGVDNEKIKTYFGSKIGQIVEAKSAKQAVELAKKLAKRGDAVLLSPACASFDLFKNYEDRGNQFKQEVKQFAIGK
jgi:UDP-N-acetylmuramoylalanine--D-glutamate ligase